MRMAADTTPSGGAAQGVGVGVGVGVVWWELRPRLGRLISARAPCHMLIDSDRDLSDKIRILGS
jgi:hypothetical protein